MIQYVIFDMDGTLLDTETLYERSWVEIGEKWGFHGMKESYYPSISGRPVAAAVEFVKEHFPGADAEAFMQERMARFDQLVEEKIPLKAGCIELLRFLKDQGTKIAVATSTVSELALKCLAKAGIDGYFDKIVTGEMVKRGKPAPDIFIEAGKQIGADLSETLVVGDASVDILGASAAGMRAVMVVDILSPTPEARDKCFAVYNSLFEVLDLIKKENEI